jgi:hypothetical protein
MARFLLTIFMRFLQKRSTRFYRIFVTWARSSGSYENGAACSTAPPKLDKVYELRFSYDPVEMLRQSFIDHPQMLHHATPKSVHLLRQVRSVLTEDECLALLQQTSFVRRDNPDIVDTSHLPVRSEADVAESTPQE